MPRGIELRDPSSTQWPRCGVLTDRHFVGSLAPPCLSAEPLDRAWVGIRRLGRTMGRYLAAEPGGQASRRISMTAVTASRMAARPTKTPVSMPWNGQNLLAGW